MATFTKSLAGGWKAVVRRKGYPTVSKTWRTKRDAQDWATSVEDEMRRGAFIRRQPAERTTMSDALDRYLAEAVPTKRESTQRGNRSQAERLRGYFGDYGLLAVTPELVAGYRDKRRLEERRAANTVRVELALLSHVFEMAIREWRLGLTLNPASAIRWPAPGAGRDRRLAADEEQRLLEA
ncbi:hypothetical protein GCM10028792_12720 [Salinisphaera aquimarina]